MEPSEEGRAVNLLRSRAGFGSGAALAEAAGLHPSVVNNIIRGKTQRLHTDTRNEIERATGVPLGTLQQVAEGNSSAEDVIAQALAGVQDGDTPTSTVTAFRSGGRGAVDDLDQLSLDELGERRRIAREEALKTVSRSVGRLELSDPPEPLSFSPQTDFVVLDRAGRVTIVDVYSMLRWFRKNESNRLTEQIGKQARWRHQGAERVVVFTILPWPDYIIDEIAHFGIEYAETQAELERLLMSDAEEQT